MEEPKHILEIGTKVKTNPAISTGLGIFVADEVLSRRVPNTEGVICGVVAGHGGDVYWVGHGEAVDGAFLMTAYGWHEFDLVKNPPLTIWEHLDEN